MSLRVFIVSILVCFASAGHARAGALVINEMMASNSTTIADADGTYADWVEFFNGGNAPVDLAGYGLSDTPTTPFKWVFPSVSLSPGAFLIVWASGKDSTNPAGALHTNFSIKVDGEALTLTRPDSTLVDSLPPVSLGSDVSYGRKPDGSDVFIYFTSATPGSSNSLGEQPVLDEPAFSHKAGFSTTAFDLSIGSPDPEATIRYTLDGSEPDETSPAYASPLPITDRMGPASGNLLIRTTNPRNAWYPPSGWVFRGTAVRAKAFRTGYLPSRTATGTYFINPTGTERYPFPVISLVTDSLNLFDADIGIYVPGSKYARTGVKEDANFYQAGGDWERPVHVQFIEPDGTVAISQDAGMRIHGNYSRDYHQKSLRLYAKSSYGQSWFEHRLFPEGDVTRFKRFLLRTGASDLYTALIRDAVGQGLMAHLNFDTQNCRPAAIFINGDYWGIQFIRDRYDEYYLQTYHGADPDNVDNIEIDYSFRDGPYGVDAGDATGYESMIAYTKSADGASPAAYEHIQTLMDVENFARYYAANIFEANTDWPHKNIRVWRARTPYNPAAGQLDGRWRWLCNDLDRGFGLRASSQFDNNTLVWATIGDPNQESTWLLRWLLVNSEFRTMFINALADQMNSTFTVTRMIGMIDSLEAQIAPGMTEHLRRWGGTSQPPSSLSQWQANVQMLRDFAARRRPYMIRHMQNYFSSLGDSVSLTIANPTPHRGIVQVNSIVLESGTPGVSPAIYPWTGTYFTGMRPRLVATPREGYTFEGWETPAGMISRSDTIMLSLPESVTITARFAGTTGVAAPPPVVDLELHQNAPNPFNPSTTIHFTLPEASPVRIVLYDVSGSAVRTLVDQTYLSGSHSVSWDGLDRSGRACASGVYLYRLTTAQGVVTKRMTLLR